MSSAVRDSYISPEARFPGQPAPSGAAGDGPVVRFTGRFGADGNTISGAWEKGRDGGEWEHDFALSYRRAG